MHYFETCTVRRAVNVTGLKELADETEPQEDTSQLDTGIV